MRILGGSFALSAILFLATPCFPQTPSTLGNFNGNNGRRPQGPILAASDGALYGTTAEGGPYGFGTVFKVSGGTLTTFYNFGNLDFDTTPAGGLIQGSDGALYGVTIGGGAHSDGSVFRLALDGTLKNLYDFSGSNEGINPVGALVQATDGNFYGMTSQGGRFGKGTIFRVNTAGSLTTLYTFGGVATDGSSPLAGLIQGSDGNLYGATPARGIISTGNGDATIFKISLAGVLTTLYEFTGGAEGPQTGLVQGSDGNFYGVTKGGAIFRMTPSGSLTTVHQFGTNESVANSLTAGTDGNLYGTTPGGGSDTFGTLFKLTISGAFTTLYHFQNSIDGSDPGGIAQAANGALYGVTQKGGNADAGTVFQFGAAASSAGPSVSSVVNAFSNSATIAPNTWVAIKGSNLAPAGDARIWQGSDFAGNQMPTSLDGVSVSMNGQPAYVYYISPTQLNVLTPPDLAAGPVQVVVTVSGTASAAFNAQAQATSLAFFVFNGGPYVVGTHLNGSDLGPTSLFPGTTTPAQPGEVIVLYGNGFGATSSPIAKGSASQSGTLATLPVIQIGGAQAVVQFAGLVSPGLYQFNVVVPGSAAGGDNSLTAQYAGVRTQTGVSLTVQSSTAPKVQSVTLSANTLMSGTSVQGTVTLSAGAPSGGIVVALTSNSNSVTIPATVTIPAGFTGASFTITAGIVSSTQSVTITATYQGSSAQATLSVAAAGGGAFPTFGYLSAQAHITSDQGGATYSATIDIVQATPTIVSCAISGQTSTFFQNPQALAFGASWNHFTTNGLTITCDGLQVTSSTIENVNLDRAQVTSGTLTFTLNPQVVSTSGTISGSFNLVSTLGTVGGTFTGTYTAQ